MAKCATSDFTMNKIIYKKKYLLSRPFKENEYDLHFYENMPDNHENMHLSKQIFCNDFLKCLYHRAIIL